MATNENKTSTSVIVQLLVEVDVGGYVSTCTLDHVTSNSVAKAKGILHEMIGTRKDVRIVPGAEPKIKAVTTIKGDEK